MCVSFCFICLWIMLLLDRSIWDNCIILLLWKVSDILVKLLILIVTFSDRRLADHFGGKLHLGYMQIRDKLAELQVLWASVWYLIIIVLLIVVHLSMLFSPGNNFGKRFLISMWLRKCLPCHSLWQILTHGYWAFIPPFSLFCYDFFFFFKKKKYTQMFSSHIMWKWIYYIT